MRVAILGFGLIGGSVARALHARAPGDWTVTAWSPSGDGPRQAQDAGEIDRAAGTIAQSVEAAEQIVLAAPPIECLDLLDQLGGPLRRAVPEGAVVTDVASTKRRLVERAAERGIRFVGGHPMAGIERTGYDAAEPNLFEGRPWVVCTDGADDVARARVEALVTAVGARPIRMDAATHDAAVAAISHLPLVVSAGLVESVFGRDTGIAEPARGVAYELAASGWRDMTRLARGDVAMGAGIAATNPDELAARLRGLREVLDRWLLELERDGGPAVDRLTTRLAAARVLAADDRAPSGS
jgi:prephenate dehydrogenase